MTKVKPRENTKVAKKHDHFHKLYKFTERNLGLVKISLNTVGTSAEKYDKKYLKQREDLFKRISSKSSITERDIFELIELNEKHPAQLMLFTRNTITSIVNIIDSVFAEILKFYYKTNPEKISGENKSISIKDLETLDNLKEAKEFLVNREIDKLLLHKGIQERLKEFRDIGLMIPTKTDHIHELNKLIKIRNLVVHNACQVDKDFEKKYATKDEKVGDSIELTKEYLAESLSVALYFCGVLIQSAQIELVKDKKDDNEHFLHDVTHKLLKEEKYQYLDEIYKLVFVDEMNIDDINKKIITINYCIGLKKQNKTQNRIDKELDKQDWTSVQDETDLQMCLHALKGEDKKFYDTLDILIERKKISQTELLDWEIFKLYSRKKKYREIVKKQIKND